MKRILFVILVCMVVAPVFGEPEGGELWNPDWTFDTKLTVMIALHQGFWASYGLMIESGLVAALPETARGQVAVDRYTTYVPGPGKMQELADFYWYVIDYLDNYFKTRRDPTLGGAFEKAILAWNNSGKYAAGYFD